MRWYARVVWAFFAAHPRVAQQREMRAAPGVES